MNILHPEFCCFSFFSVYCCSDIQKVVLEKVIKFFGAVMQVLVFDTFQIFFSLSNSSWNLNLQPVGWIKVILPCFPWVWLALTPNKSCEFHHFYNSHLLAGTTKNIFLVGNGVRLTHLSVIAKRYNSPVRLVHAFTPNILVSLVISHIYQPRFVTIHLWRFGAFISWSKFSLHYPVFPGIWLPFPPKFFLVSFIIFEILF